MMGHYHSWPSEVRPETLAEQATVATSPATNALTRKLMLSVLHEQFKDDPNWKWIALAATDIADGVDLAEDLIGMCEDYDAEQAEQESEGRTDNPWGSYEDYRFEMARDARDGGWL